MLAGGVRALAIHGVQQDLALPTEVVVELDHPVLGSEQVQPWLAPRVQALENEAGLSWAWYRAGVEHVIWEPSLIRAFAFAQRFGPAVWRASGSRRAPASSAAATGLRGRILQLGSEAGSRARRRGTPPSSWLACQAPGCSRDRSSRCDLDAVVAGSSAGCTPQPLRPHRRRERRTTLSLRGGPRQRRGCPGRS